MKKPLYSSVEEAGVAYQNKEIDLTTFQEQLGLFTNQGQPKDYTYNGLKLEINTDFLAEHYYNPILLTSETRDNSGTDIVRESDDVSFFSVLSWSCRTLFSDFESGSAFPFS